VSGGFRFLTAGVKKHQSQVAQVITEEWKLAPGALEAAWFTDEVAAVERQTLALEARLKKMLEGNP